MDWLRKNLYTLGVCIFTAALSASLVLTVMSLDEGRADKLAKQNRTILQENKKLRKDVQDLTDLVAESNHRIAQLEDALRRHGIPIPGEDGGTGRTDTSSRQRRAAP